MVKMVNCEKQKKNASGCGSVFVMNLFICCRSIRFDRRIVDGDLHTVDVSALFVDDEQLEQSVLVTVGRPPFGSEDTAYIAEVSGRNSKAETGIVDIKADVRRPVVGAAGCFGTDLH